MPNENTIARLGKQPSPHSGFTSFKRWVKKTILRNLKNHEEKQERRSITSQIILDPPTPDPHPHVRSHKKSSSSSKKSSKKVPLKRSPSGKRRRHRKQPRPRSSLLNLKSNEDDEYENWVAVDDANDKVDNNNKNYKNKNNVGNNNGNNGNDIKGTIPRPDEYDWADDEILNKNELIIPKSNPTLFEMNTDIYEMSAVISRSLSDKDQQPLPFGGSYSKDDFLENTHIIKGSVEHFAYVRTLKKLRGKDMQRPIRHVLLLNNILEELSFSQLSDEILKLLNHYKKRVTELNKIKPKSTSSSNNREILPYSSPNESTSTLCPSSLTNKKLSAMLTEAHPTSPIKMKYRPSYASSKVVTIFDEDSNQLVIKELPLARRKRRLSDLSNVLNRSASSSATSTNSSQSSLVTLTDEVEQHQYPSLTTKEPDSFLSNLVIQNDDEDNDEDNVPLFVLKEQFRYSGRGHAPLTIPSAGSKSNDCINYNSPTTRLYKVQNRIGNDLILKC